MCANNKYAHHTPQKWHMSKLLYMCIYGVSMPIIYTTYEAVPINDVARIAVHKDMTTTQDDYDTQPDYIYWVGHLAKSVKNVRISAGLFLGYVTNMFFLSFGYCKSLQNTCLSLVDHLMRLLVFMFVI